MNFENMTLKKFAAFVYETLKKNNIDAVLVGGACVSIYSENRYLSMDADFATYEELKVIEKVLSEYGFKKTGRCFSNPKCPYVIDFVNPPITVGHEAVRKFHIIHTSAGELQLLSPTDCVKDRLAAFFHWNDKQALEQAVLVAQAHAIDEEKIKFWAELEGFSEKLNLFFKRLSRFK